MDRELRAFRHDESFNVKCSLDYLAKFGLIIAIRFGRLNEIQLAPLASNLQGFFAPPLARLPGLLPLDPAHLR